MAPYTAALEEYASLLRAGPSGLLSRNDRERIADHIADALGGVDVVQSLQPQSVVDVGSGGGFPAIPLALALESSSFELVESSAWKAAFLAEVIEAVNLSDRTRVHTTRVEEIVALLGREMHDVATARALAPTVVALEYLAPLVRVGGAVVLWSTNQALAPGISGDVLDKLGLRPPAVHQRPSVLRSDGALGVWHKHAPTIATIPRRTGVASKRPLASPE